MAWAVVCPSTLLSAAIGLKWFGSGEAIILGGSLLAMVPTSASSYNEPLNDRNIGGSTCPRGSLWHKWDPHIHTPESHEHNFKLTNNESAEYGADSWLKYVDALEAETDTPAIAITDYFSIDGYRKILDFRNAGRLKNFDLILPNIEFRLDKVLATRDGEPQPRLNYHVLFSDEVDVNKIQTEFLQAIDIETEDIENRTLTRQNIEEIGKNLKEHHEQFQNRDDYYVGCTNIYVSLDQIIDILRQKSSIFEGKYLLMLADDYWSRADWDQAHLLRRSLLVKSHGLFASNPKTREWAVGRGTGYSTQNAFIREFGRLFPSIHGSDAHSFENLFRPDLDRYCWIKADLTFEGLKQIVFEPEGRVRIQPDNPEPRKSLYTLDAVEPANTEISTDVALTDQAIPLNWNLVAVTGGKGSGKTALLDLVANVFENRTRSSGDDENSFVQRIQDQKPDLRIAVSFLGKDTDRFSKELMETSFFENTQVTYLPQGKIEDISGHRERMNRIIREIIFSNKSVIEAGFGHQFDEMLNELGAINDAIDLINLDLEKLEQEVEPEALAQIGRSLSLKEGELKDKQDEFGKFAENMQAGEIANIEEIESKEAALEEQLVSLETLVDSYSDLMTAVDSQVDELNMQIAEINSMASEFNKIPELPPIEKRSLVAAIGKSSKVTTKLADETRRQKTETADVLDQLTDDERVHAELVKEVRDLNAEIGEITLQLKELDEKKQAIGKLEGKRLRNYKETIETHNRLRRYYRRVIREFSRGRSKILSGIDFHSAIHFSRSRFMDQAEDLLDSRMVREDELEVLAAELEGAINESSKPKRSSAIDSFMEQMSELRDKAKKARSRYDFSKWCYGNYFELSTDVLFNKIQLDKLSMGQKGTVLLKLFLAEGDHPLIVDQPEESLDNEFIYQELVGAIREAKTRRQVIIATNNANLVVNTDAEQIVVAEFASNVIQYHAGTLENPQTRAEIVPILEGGEEAFKRRESRYGF